MDLENIPLAMLLQAAAPSSPLADYVTLWRLAEVAALLVLTWLLIRYTTRLLNFVGARSTRARFAVRSALPGVRVLLWLGAFVLAIRFLAPTTEAFYAGIASIGLAIGLGAQDLVRNLIGGLVILSDRPFQIGDRVRVGNAYGEIDHIGLHSTRLTTPDDTQVTIPNSDVVSSQVFNSNSGVPDCQVVTDLYLPPGTDPKTAIRIGYEAALASPYLLVRKPVVALVSDQVGEVVYMRLRIKAYVYDHRFEPRMQSDITTRAKGEFLRLGLLNEWMTAGESAAAA
jgi:small-conductance mechanosensitive channel